MRVGLPYRFDTSYIGTLVFKAAACLEAVLLLGLLVKLLTGANKPTAGRMLRNMPSSDPSANSRQSPRTTTVVNVVNRTRKKSAVAGKYSLVTRATSADGGRVRQIVEAPQATRTITQISGGSM